jgi:hypothetical protein
LLEIIVEIMNTTKSEKGNEGAEGRREDSQLLMHM